jgi:hypothetical protein
VKVEKKAEAPKDPLVLNYTLNESEIKSDINDIADDWINQSSKFRSKLAPAKVKVDRGVLSVGDVNFEKGAAVIVTSSVTKSDFFGRLPSFTVFILIRLCPCISLYTSVSNTMFVSSIICGVFRLLVGVVTAINLSELYIKTADGSRCRIYVSHIQDGRVTIKEDLESFH